MGSITHTFVSTNTDAQDATYVGKNEWNDPHTITGLAVGFIGAKALNTAGTTINNNAETTVPFAATDDYDSDGFHDPSSSNTRMTIPAGLGGKYNLEARVRIGSFTFTDLYAYFLLNGTGVLGMWRIGAAITGSVGWGTTWNGSLNAGDYVEFVILQNSGGNRALSSTSGDNYFAIHKLDSGTVGTAVGALAYNNTTQGSLAATTVNALSLNSEEWDSDSFHDNSTFNTRMTIGAGLSGRYLAVGKTKLDQAFELYIRKNGSTILRGGNHQIANQTAEVANVVDLVATDYVEVCEYHDTGTATAGDASNNHLRTELSLTRVDALPSSGPVLLLDHAYGSDDTNVNLAQNTSWTDLSANETFTKVRGSSLIRIAAKVAAQANESTAGDDQVGVRLLIDSAGTPVSIMVATTFYNSTMGSDYFAVAGSTSEIVSGLASGSHTIKWQANTSAGSTSSFYLRPSGAAPYEFAKCQVIEEGP